ncbi:MAG TPA: ferric reductase-like transmembrane domain-containing protein [Caulobacteraceae bacterium]|jgi:sulfoxide reductase heme-binding subunit YedZ
MSPASDRWLKPLAYLSGLALASWMLWFALHPRYAFHVDRINKDMGLWSLRFLFACLLISPVSRWTRQAWLRRWRRPLGLLAFAFALLHTLHFLVWGKVWPDRMGLLLQRPYLVIGIVALILFIPLALTSNDAAVRWATPRRWRRLHLLAYPGAALSVIHEVMAYGPLKGEAGLYCVLTVLLVGAKGMRLAQEAGRRRGPARSAPLAAE